MGYVLYMDRSAHSPEYSDLLFRICQDIMAGVVLFLFNTAYARIKRIQRQDLPKFLLLAFFEPFIYFICETYGLKLTGSPTLSAMVIATIPIFSIGAGIIFFREKINLVNIGGILLTLVGIVMVAMAHGTQRPIMTFCWLPPDRLVTA